MGIKHWQDKNPRISQVKLWKPAQWGGCDMQVECWVPSSFLKSSEWQPHFMTSFWIFFYPMEMQSKVLRWTSTSLRKFPSGSCTAFLCHMHTSTLHQARERGQRPWMKKQNRWKNKAKKRVALNKNLPPSEANSQQSGDNLQNGREHLWAIQLVRVSYLKYIRDSSIIKKTNNLIKKYKQPGKMFLSRL
jgi:hypothetical protein